MGLDITAYSNLQHIGLHQFDLEENEGEPGPWCFDEDHVQAFAYDSFPRSFRGIPILAAPTGFPAQFLFGGCFAMTEGTDVHRFHAGSYGGYNQWRSNLADQFNPAPVTAGLRPSMAEPDPDRPFYELIWFADNEGSIGAKAAADLLEDFRTHEATYRPAWDGDTKYKAWMRACELAAQSGLIRFH